jgi:hypothetical protein
MLAEITKWLEWMTIINLAMYVFSVVLLLLLKETTYRMHSKLFAMDQSQVAAITYTYFGIYKLLIIVFNIAPLIALYLVQIE